MVPRLINVDVVAPEIAHRSPKVQICISLLACSYCCVRENLSEIGSAAKSGQNRQAIRQALLHRRVVSAGTFQPQSRHDKECGCLPVELFNNSNEIGASKGIIAFGSTHARQRDRSRHDDHPGRQGLGECEERPWDIANELEIEEWRHLGPWRRRRRDTEADPVRTTRRRISSMVQRRRGFHLAQGEGEKG